ncbi:ROK family protein [Gephyromycinifex aptenodytis]|uniref:ROK family protein n=1 Tax=Gephyromycinifex aptenodytis TaxID=2716227 RepID=UPI001446B0E0|nr:ROK family protein [Gephyromycinifex aptenodytis]
MSLTVGLDIGGTKLAGAVVDEEGNVLARARRETPASATSDIVSAAADLVDELAGDHDVVGVGVACAGFIDRSGTTVMFAPNLPWRDEPLKAKLEDLTRLPVQLLNDANAAAWGEFVHGSAADVDHMVFLTIGTGVGGGIVENGRLLRGAFGVAAELGHIRMVPGGRLCGCGVHGCLEQYASGTALVRAARELVASGDQRGEGLAARCSGDPRSLTGPDVTKAAQEGDIGALSLIAELGRWIGEGAASIGSVLDPEVIVIGGGVASAGALLLDPAAEAYEEYVTGRGYRPYASWRLASLGNEAGMIGAAAQVRP